MMTPTRAALLAATLLGTAGAAAAPAGWAAPEEPAALSGTYASAAPEPLLAAIPWGAGAPISREVSS